MSQITSQLSEEVIDREESNQRYDVIIIGGGPAGLVASIYTARANLDTILIEKGPLGGQLSWIKQIDNYPGFPEGISGAELASLMESQAIRFGVKIEKASVIDIKIEPDIKIVKTDTRNFEGKAVIITTGISKKKQTIDGEEKFKGIGVSYCAICDGPFFRNKDIAIMGGGDEALEEGIFLTQYARKVTIIHSQDKLTAGEEIQKMAKKKENISFLLNSMITKIAGAEKVEFIEVLDLNTGNTNQLPMGGVFLYIGTRPAKDFLGQLIELDQHGYIITDEDMKTSVDGIFAAGDVRNKKVRQIATAVGDAVTAATSARKYIQRQKI